MLSIVISSYRQDYFISIERNIADTIGAEVVYEIIQIKNPGIMSLCEAYNKGLDQSRYPFVLFLHEDLFFNNVEWGHILFNIFEANNKIALIGVAGGLYKSKAPSGWWDIDDTAKYIYVRHGSKTENTPMHYGFGIHTREHIVRVLSIDGLFIALRKSTGLKFNEQLKGFHQYDLGISIDAHLKGFDAVCTNLIDITHYSMGNVDQKWVESADKFSDLYARYLPLCVAPEVSQRERIYWEKRNYVQFINSAWAMRLDKMARKYWWQFFKFKPFSDKPFKLLKRLNRERSKMQ